MMQQRCCKCFSVSDDTETMSQIGHKDKHFKSKNKNIGTYSQTLIKSSSWWKLYIFGGLNSYMLCVISFCTAVKKDSGKTLRGVSELHGVINEARNEQGFKSLTPKDKTHK